MTSDSGSDKLSLSIFHARYCAGRALSQTDFRTEARFAAGLACRRLPIRPAPAAPVPALRPCTGSSPVPGSSRQMALPKNSEAQRHTKCDSVHPPMSISSTEGSSRSRLGKRARVEYPCGNSFTSVMVTQWGTPSNRNFTGWEERSRYSRKDFFSRPKFGGFDPLQNAHEKVIRTQYKLPALIQKC